MTADVNNLLKYLQTSKYVQSDHTLVRLLNNVKKFSENDESALFALGFIFKGKNIVNTLEPEEKQSLVACISKPDIAKYFYHRQKPELNSLKAIIYPSFIAGFILCIMGIIFLLEGRIVIGVNLRYLSPFFNNGGYYILFSIVLLVGSISRYKFEKNRDKFFTDLSNLTF